MGKFVDLTDQKFGRLAAKVYFVGSRWFCVCDCGNWCTVMSKNIRHTYSCGCLLSEGNNRQHGQSTTPEYHIYQQAKQRCINPKAVGFPDYGGRGIQFKFNSFEQWFAELGKRPDGAYPNGKSLWSVDRINNDGHYEVGNVKWSTASEQQNNQRRRTV